jgi:hypothetical protein
MKWTKVFGGEEKRAWYRKVEGTYPCYLIQPQVNYKITCG